MYLFFLNLCSKVIVIKLQYNATYYGNFSNKILPFL